MNNSGVLGHEIIYIKINSRLWLVFGFENIK
nr:MAG TPA: hypothetical protein [Caudoviricetes sp.]